MEAYHRLSLTINAIAPDDSYRPPTLVGMRKAAAAIRQHLGHEVCGVSIQPFQLNTTWEPDWEEKRPILLGEPFLKK